MSNPFLPPPQTNEMLVVAEFTKHLAEERLERRRRLPGVVARNTLLITALAIVFAASCWVASRVVDMMDAHAAEVHNASGR